jgi:tRNA(fMet)-specific endonuclease VapC
MKYLLDTNTCIEFLRRSDSPVKQKLAQTDLEDVGLCSVVKAELYHGAQKSVRSEDNLALMRDFFATFNSLPFDDAAAEVYGRLRAFLEKRGEPLGPNDLLIASIAIARGVILVTHNTAEFKRVPDLDLEDWQV